MLTIQSTINIAGQTVPQIIPVVQGDTGRSILFTRADVTIPQGSTATYYVQKPSGEAVYNAATIDGNTVLVELTAQSIIEHGDNYGQVRIENDGEVVTSFDFILLVKPFRGIDATQSTTEMNIFDKAVEQAEEAIDDAKDAALDEINQTTGNFAEAFSASKAYSAGEYVMQLGRLYRFTSNHAAGAWTGSDAEAVTVGEELTDVKDGLSETDRVLTLDDQVTIPFTIKTNGKYIKYSDGTEQSSSSYATTDYVRVDLYESISYRRIINTNSATNGMAFYDESQNYISGVRSYPNGSEPGYLSELYSVIVPLNAVYARFTIWRETETYGEFEVKGTSKLHDRVNDIDDRVITNEDILSFGDNIPIDFDITEKGRYIKYSDGASAASTPYNCTGYINISKYAILNYQRIRLTGSGTTGMAFYDASKQYISGVVGITNESERGYKNGTVAVPSNAVYARFSTLADTTLYGDFLLSGQSKLFNSVYLYKSPYQKNIVFGSYSSDWYEGQGESYSGFTINTLYSEMITAWDALVANSKGYVTKDEIGTASDNQTMYCYKLIPSRYRNNTGTSVTSNPPTFLIIPSIHGYEKSAAFGTYYFARDLVYNFNKNPVLNSLRTKCAIYIVPVGNPYGFDNKERKNANGVDLNRNWGVDPSGETDPSSPYYPGAEPFDQPETQAIKGLIDSNTNIFYVVDYHTNGQYKAASWADVNWMTYFYIAIYGDAYSRLVYVASQNQISDITENLQMEYSLDTNGESIGSITLGAQDAPRPTITWYTRTTLNIMGGTFEGNNGLPSEESSYSATEQKINSELIGNWIKNLLLVYKDASLK